MLWTSSEKSFYMVNNPTYIVTPCEHAKKFYWFEKVFGT